MSSAERVLVLVGPMGAGKTSVGRRVARVLGLPFRDTDKAIAREHGPIPEIFATHGEEQFRAWEREAVSDAIAEGGVISVGGGAVLSVETRRLLATVPVVLLTVTPDAVASRISGSGRPLLAGEEDPLRRWTRIMDERRSWYEEVADVVFDTSRTPMARVAGRVAEWMRGRE
ncbi:MULTISPECIES: shikimate kinase [Bacteria]|uniref:shikimate kinase n=1 Tax=Bacteria TaxID=2 RepID=UPI003C7B2B3B